MDPEIRFRALFDVAYGPLCRYARYRGLTGPDAEDLVAQTPGQILLATPANRSLLTPPIPPGFTRTASSPNF